MIETLGMDALGETGQAVATVALVLAESIALYVGYGALSRLAGATVLDTLGGE